MNSHFEKEIDRLKKKILTQCAVVEENLSRAVVAVSENDTDAAKEVINNDVVIDQNEIEIEEECLKLLALYQPVATDLRYVIVCLKVNNDLERIGDLSCNIAKCALKLAKNEELDLELNGLDFSKMMETTQKMLNHALDSLVRSDTLLALNVIKRDDEVDKMNSQNHDKISELIQKKPEYASFYIYQLSVSRQLERIADVATNISEDVMYMATGNIVRHAGANLPS